VTDKGRLDLAGASVVSERELFCPKCGESRLCEVITTAKHSHGFCKICGKPFPLKVAGTAHAGA
jgi:transcription elongation factor Elf1